MAHFGTDELLFPQRTRLPLVRQMCACALSKAPLSNDCADNDAGFPDPSSRRWRFVATQQEASAAGIAPNQRLQYLCLKQIIRTHLVPDPRGCPLGFESDFARILADLMDSRRRPGKEEEEEEEVRKAAGGQADLPKRAFPASFVEFQRFIRSSIFFLPYLKYSFQMNIINRSMSEGQVAALNPHFFSMTSHTGQGQVSSPADGSSVGFYSNLARDSERDCATLKVTLLGLPSSRLVTDLVRQLLAEFSTDGILHCDHALLSFQSYFEGLPRRVHAGRDLVKFSASFPRGHAFTSDWQEYLDRTVRWCERLMADTSLLCETPGDAATLRPRVDVRRPVEETRTEGPRCHRDMIHYKSVNYQDHLMEEFM